MSDPAESASTSTSAPVPCHIVAGPLGVGKTTAILDHLRRNAGREKVGVLVNDFGPIGLDGAILAAEAPGARVASVPGGCICCTMLDDLVRHVEQLLVDHEVTRLIIEPSGMASPASIVDLLRHHERQLGIRIQPVIVLLNVAGFDEQMYDRMPYFQVFCESADVLVFNQADKAKPGKLAAAQAWAGRLDPPKLRVLVTEHGVLPDSLFTASPSLSDHGSAHDHAQDHQHDHGVEHEHHHDHDHGDGSDAWRHDMDLRAGGFIRPAEERFDDEQLLINLMRVCHQGVDGVTILRLKGVFNTTAGWQAIHIANREVEFRPSAHRRDNRIDWITQGGDLAPERMIEELLRPLDVAEISRTLEEDAPGDARPG